MTITIPQIISVGPPPEQHADRVVSEMLEFIVRLRGAVWAKGEATLPPSAMGNPTSQARHVARLRKLNGALWPFLHLTLGSAADIRSSLSKLRAGTATRIAGSMLSTTSPSGRPGCGYTWSIFGSSVGLTRIRKALAAASYA